MTSRNRIEELRGEPIAVNRGSPADIPYVETSDLSRLCSRPLVSVVMITYNHIKYIRQAIEGVLRQETDFDYELVIGDDASTDGTREVCFEYQKNYPEKIRVLWWHQNLYGGKCAAGGNGVRTRFHSRGEFVALCEGDDYWIDPRKLQKQIDVLRANPKVSLCYTDGYLQRAECDFLCATNKNRRPRNEVTPGREFLLAYAGEKLDWILTASIVYRKSAYLESQSTPLGVVSKWRLCMSDITLVLLCASQGDVCYIDEPTMVYRTGVGVMTGNSYRVGRDADCISWYFLDFYGDPGKNKSKFSNRAVRYRIRRIPWLRWRERLREISRLKRLAAGGLFEIDLSARDYFQLLTFALPIVGSYCIQFVLKLSRSLNRRRLLRRYAAERVAL